MTEPQPIEFSKIQVGDKIGIRRVENAGTENEIVSTIQGVSSGLVSSGSICFRGSCISYLHDEKNTITLLHRPPTRRRITFDELKDWRAVPIGTKIEFKNPRELLISMTLSTRTEYPRRWAIQSAAGIEFGFDEIKEDTLFVIEEEAKP